MKRRIKTSLHLSRGNVAYLRARESRIRERGTRRASLEALVEAALSQYATSVEAERMAEAGDSVLVTYRVAPEVLVRAQKAARSRGETLSSGLRRHLRGQQAADEHWGVRSRPRTRRLDTLGDLA